MQIDGAFLEQTKGSWTASSATPWQTAWGDDEGEQKLWPSAVTQTSGSHGAWNHWELL
jgi:hypothetical protein